RARGDIALLGVRNERAWREHRSRRLGEAACCDRGRRLHRRASARRRGRLAPALTHQALPVNANVAVLPSVKVITPVPSPVSGLTSPSMLSGVALQPVNAK